MHDINFDNIVTSLVALFVLSTLEGWPDYIFYLIDSGPPTTGPILDNKPVVYLFFFFFILIGSVICVNLFVAIISMNFKMAQTKGNEERLSDEQERWIKIVMWC